MPVLRQLLIVVVLGAIAAGGYAFQTGVWPLFGGKSAVPSKESGKPRKQRGKSASPVLVEKVRLETFHDLVEAVGTTRALQSIAIVPFSSGRIRSLSIEPGQSVKQGDILATLDDDIQRADLAETQARLQEATRALARAEKLYRKRNIAEARVIELQAKRAIAEADLARAKKRLADRTVRAPFAGRVGMRQVDVGARVDTENTLTILDDISSIEIEAQISEGLFPLVRKGARVSAESAAFPGRRFTGVIAAIDRRIDPVTRGFKIRVRIPNKDEALPAGMFMRVALQLDERKSAAVPEEALVVQAERKFVFVVDDEAQSVSRVEVTTGQRRDGLIEIVTGAQVGATVVKEGTHRLRDGAKVRIGSDDAEKSATAPSPTAKVSGARKKDGS